MSECEINYKLEAIHVLKIGLFPVLLFIALSGYNFITCEQATYEYVIISIDENIIDNEYNIIYLDGYLTKEISLDKSEYGVLLGDKILITYNKYRLSDDKLILVEVI